MLWRYACTRKPKSGSILVWSIYTMITEITTALFFALAAIGGIMAFKWKARNAKPRMSEEELDKFYKRHDIERE